MAFLAAIPAAIGSAVGSIGGAGSALSAIGTGLGLVGTVASASSANRAAQQDALNMEAQGKEDLAASQREAMSKRREGALVNSRAQALAAASGGGADDPTIVRLMTNTAKDADYNARTVMYGGKSRQMGLNQSATARRREGKSSLLGGVLGGFGKALGSFG